jgi:general L-amino acid transport system permease protein
VSAPIIPEAVKPPWYRDVRILRVVAQLAFCIAVVVVGAFLFNNLLQNMQRSDLSTDWNYLRQPAGFRIAGSDFLSGDSNTAAIVVGIKHTLMVAIVGIILATILGIIVGVGRLSKNWLISKIAALYVQSLRNIPVLVTIIFVTVAVVYQLPRLGAPIGDDRLFIVSNRGIWIPWLSADGLASWYWIVIVLAVGAAARTWVWRMARNAKTGTPDNRVGWSVLVFAAVMIFGYFAMGMPFSISLATRDTQFIVTGGLRLVPEYVGLLVGLTIYTASHIAEIVRGGIMAVPKGQGEAAEALALSSFQRLRFIVLPQALRTMIPPLSNQYLNLTKNTSLAVAIGYAELTQITTQIISSGRAAPQNIALLMLIYLLFSLIIAFLANLANRRLQFVGR